MQEYLQNSLQGLCMKLFFVFHICLESIFIKYTVEILTKPEKQQ